MDAQTLSARQVAARLGITINRLRSLRRAGEFPGTTWMDGRTPRYMPQDVDDYLDRNRIYSGLGRPKKHLQGKTKDVQRK